MKMILTEGKGSGGGGGGGTLIRDAWWSEVYSF